MKWRSSGIEKTSTAVCGAILSACALVVADATSQDISLRYVLRRVEVADTGWIQMYVDQDARRD